MNPSIRDERPTDIDAIARLTEAAFASAPHTSHTEQFIVAALREAGQLSISLVALEGDELVGHVAVSPVTLSSGDRGWYGLGPISVRPDRQGHGIGSALMAAAIGRLETMGSAGCVLLGDPDYYARFGFRACRQLVLPGVPPEYFQALPLAGGVPAADVSYHAAFDATA
ncbi:GNAT family N-acetyltransferase [Stenotrophomonas acidaminiphila]